MTRLCRLFVAIALVAGALSALPAVAAYPDRPIKIVLPYSAGGIGDLLLRAVQPELEKQLGQNLIIEYRTGAAGNIGTSEVVNAAPDGYTLLYAPTNNFVINQFLFSNLGYDPLQALAPISLLAETPYFIFINSQVPATNFKEFTAYARAHPGKLNYGSPGSGTVPHLSAFMLSEALGAHMVHVPYRGAQPGVQALLTNDVQMFIISYGLTGPLLAAGKLRALAVAASHRFPALPDVPTTAEVGLAPDVILGNWWAIAAPKGTDPAILRRWSEAIAIALRDPGVQKRYAQAGAVPAPTTPAECAQRIASDARGWKAIVEKSGVN
ncbi:MAG: tripartite tricarboxylate transporter substrate binding protein [Betaproteobacteria bacterium]|nr:MAG: tripartite tricarboxylate transporter substrate binding protein [Betaproteobacteria bacterium]